MYFIFTINYDNFYCKFKIKSLVCPKDFVKRYSSCCNVVQVVYISYSL